MRWRVVLCVLFLPALVHAQPTVRAVGGIASGAGAVSPTLPTGTCSGDLLLMACETAAQSISVVGGGWAAVPGECSPIGTGASTTTDTLLTVLYRVADTCSPSCTCTDATTTTDSGNHQICRIIGITTGTYNSSDPFDACTNNTQTSNTTSVSVSGTTASESASLVVAFTAGAADGVTGTTTFSSEANANLASITERIDNGTDAGNGGLLGAWSGVKTDAGAWSNTTATSATSTTWANMSLNIRAAATFTPTPTNTATRTHTATVTNTPTVTHTPTSTATPTVAAGCHRATFTPAASADDVLLRSTNNAAAAMTTGGTTITFGVWDFFGTDLEDVAALRFNTAPVIPDSATVTAAWLALYTTAASTLNAGTREFIGEWTSNQGAWSAASDWENELSPANAFQFPFPTDIGTVDRYRTIPLSNPSNVDISGSYTGIKMGATNPGAPTGADSIVWNFQSVDGANPPVLHVEYCDPTPTNTATFTHTATVTHTATATHTATVTNTPTATATGTPTLPDTRNRCPDRDGDAQCGVLLIGTERTAGVFPWLAWLAPSADMLCDATATGMTSGQMRAVIEGMAAGDTCTDLGGTVVRGADLPPDMVIIDIGALVIAEQAVAATAPSAENGICHGPGVPCRVEAPLGFTDDWASDVHAKCTGGADWRTPCIPGNGDCAGDEHNGDPFRSLCQPWLYGNGEDGVIVANCPEATCQHRPHVHSVYRNIIRAVRAIRALKRVVSLQFPWMPAEWTDGDGTEPVAVASVPNADYPNSTVAAEHEVAAPMLRLLRSWLHAHRENELTGDISFIDHQRDFELETGGRAFEALGDQTNLATSAQAGRCTCVTNADCGGTCTGGVCVSGLRASCSDNGDCYGSDSAQMPGTAFCLSDQAYRAAWLIHACVEDLATSLLPELETDGRLCCSEPCIPRPPEAGAWNTSTPTRTETRTPTVTYTFTPPSTSTATPVESNTPNGDTPTPTYTVGLPPATIPSTSSCWKGGDNGKLADIFGAQCRRALTEWSQCMWGTGKTIAECATSVGACDYEDVPDSITYAMRIDGSFSDSREVCRIGFHAVEDKLSKFCTADQMYLYWSWVRWRALQLGDEVPPWEPLLVHSHRPERLWDGWFGMVNKHFMFDVVNMLQGFVLDSTAVIDEECSGIVIDEIGYRLFDDWMARGLDKCREAYSAARVNSACGGFKPPQEDFDAWCAELMDFLLPLWQGVRATEGKPCRVGRCAVTGRWCATDDQCIGGGGSNTCVLTGWPACP